MNLIPSAIAAAALLGIGFAARDQRQVRTLLLAVGALVIFMALSRGFYWNIFGRGQGLVTANRVSAFILLVTCLIAPSLGRRRA